MRPVRQPQRRVEVLGPMIQGTVTGGNADSCGQHATVRAGGLTARQKTFRDARRSLLIGFPSLHIAPSLPDFPRR